MATERQINANRENARHSTGPKTPEGKARSSANAIRHGLLARQIVLPIEDRAQYLELLAALEAEHQPDGPLETYLVHQMASAQWRLQRLTRIETGFFICRLEKVRELEYEDDDEDEKRQRRIARPPHPGRAVRRGHPPARRPVPQRLRRRPLRQAGPLRKRAPTRVLQGPRPFPRRPRPPHAPAARKTPGTKRTQFPGKPQRPGALARRPGPAQTARIPNCSRGAGGFACHSHPLPAHPRPRSILK